MEVNVPVLRMERITKRFGPLVANDAVSLQLAAGEVLGLLGENGAGKSTLVSILFGHYVPDEGRIEVAGRVLPAGQPRAALAAGIGMVHQHFTLADNLSVLENVVLGTEPFWQPFTRRAQARARLLEVAQRFGLSVAPDALVGALSVGERQRVEILKALYRGARILILDEPTAVLVPHEVDELFDSLADLKAQGVTVIFISHKLDEVLRVADSITVLRAGRTVGHTTPSEVTAQQLAEMMVGSELPKPDTTGSTVTDVVELELDHVSLVREGRAVVDDVSFRVRRGEVVGIAGVEGNGQTELVDVILGLEQATTGRVLLAGRDITDEPTRDRRHEGVGYIPADRQRHGLLLPSPLWENAMLGHQDVRAFTDGFWVDRKGARERTSLIMEEFDVRSPGVDVPAHALSGGNQQKLIVGREMTAKPQLLVAGHPTRGIDVGAQAAVWQELRAARAAGLAVLLVSADLEELIGLSDTLLVMLRGKIVAQLDPLKVTPKELGSYMTGAAA
jgi:simple sugar transport system ATP-binding protein